MDKNYSRQGSTRNARSSRPSADPRSNRPANSRSVRPAYESANKSAYRPSSRDGRDGYAHRSAGKRNASGRRKPARGLKRILVILIALAITAAIVWLFVSDRNKTVHMLPTIERIPEYTEETAVPQ